MTKSILLLVLAISNQFISAQPVITAANTQIAVHGTAYTANAAKFSAGKLGANQIWDYTNLKITPAGTIEITPSDAFNGKSQQNNLCVHYQGSTTESFTNYDVSNAVYSLTSQSFSEFEVFDYSDPRTLAVFPYQYQSVFSDTYQISGEQEMHHVTATYDAYGTLKLPFGTYTNVIRQKTVTDGQTDYIWFNVSPFYPILQTSLADGVVGLINGNAATENATLQANIKL